MEIFMKKQILLVSCLVLSTTRFAHATEVRHPGHHRPWGPRCFGLQVVTTLESSTSAFSESTCEVGDKLAFSRIAHDYPLLGSLTVDYWQGSYTRQAATTDTYQDNYYDCWGNLQNSSSRTVVTPFTETFTLDNPNLHDDVNYTFLANAPLTDDEAKTAYDKLQQDCLAATVPGAQSP
jgi:hypothetical protein